MIKPKQHVRDIFRTPPPAESRFALIRMDKNEFLPCWPQEWFRDFMAGIGPECLSVHPELGPLYAKIEQVLGFRQDSIVVTAGSDAAIRAAFDVFVSPGDEVLVPSPTFAMYYVYARVFGARLVEVNYEATSDGPLLDPQKLMEAIGPRTRMVAIANPNSPTGTVIRQDDLKALIRRASEHGAAVLVDEAYYPFHEETIAEAVGGFDNLIVTRTFSKAAGLAGMRVAFTISNPEVARMLFGVKPMYEVTTLSAMLAEHVLAHHERVLEYAHATCEGRGYLAGVFRSRGYDVYEGHANFLHVDFGPDRDRMLPFLQGHGVLFKVSFKEPALRRYSRFTVGPKESLRPFVDILEQFR